MKAASAGFSLVELFVAIAMGMVLLIALWGVHATTASSQAYRQMLVDLTSEGNLLQSMFSGRLAQAGFWGYRHIDKDYPVTNFVCPSLLGSTLAAVNVMNAVDGQHLQINYLDSTATAIDAVSEGNKLELSRTSAFTRDMVVGVGDLSQGWVTKIANVSQRGQVTQLTLTQTLPSFHLPAIIGEFHGIDVSVNAAGKGKLGLWEQACDAKRGLLFDNLSAWQVEIHTRLQQGFVNTGSTMLDIDGLRLMFLIYSEQPILTAPMHYLWRGQSVQAGDKRFYLPWELTANLAQMAPLGA